MRPGVFPVTSRVRDRRHAGRSRTIFSTVFGLAVILLVAGCSAAGTGASASAGGLTTLTVAAVPGIDDAPLYIAADDGQFAAAGLKVRIRDYGSASSEIAALKAGRADVAAGDYADFLYAQYHQGGLLVVAEGYDAVSGVMGVLVLPGSRITTPKQLAGKAIGTPEPQEIPYSATIPYSSETLATQSVLQDDGVDPASVRWKPMPTPDLIGALSSHKVAAILVAEPYIFRAESQIGASELVDSVSGTTANLPLSGYFTSTSFARAHAGALDSFRAILQKVQPVANKGAAVRTTIKRTVGLNAQTAALVTIGEYQTSADVSGLQRVADLLVDFGVIATPLHIQNMIFR
jgi:NitT/TauT family transport system substrate-binding protein